MPLTLPAARRRDVVARLRAAGCVFAEDEARLLAASARTEEELDGFVSRRVAGVPLEHVVGWAEFCGLRIAVDARVFVPRRRTELLVREAVAAAEHADAARHRATARHVVVDLCCGSGAIGRVVAEALGGTELHAVDDEPAAVRCARRNVGPVGGHVHQGDLYAPLPPALRGGVDLVVANAPYVPTAAFPFLPPEAREHEPRTALDGGDDGLDVLRRVIAGAPGWLTADGSVLVEAGEGQVPELVDVVRRADLVPRVVRSDDLGATVVAGGRPPAPVPPP